MVKGDISKMKKNLFRLLAYIMAFVMLLSLTACGVVSKLPDSNSVSSVASSKVESREEASSEASSETSTSNVLSTNTDQKYSTIEEYLADPSIKSTLEKEMESIESDADYEISANGNKVVYSFTFKEYLADVDIYKPVVEELMNEDSFSKSFVYIASSLSEMIDADDVSVVVSFFNSDGTEIYSQEYFPE